MGLPALLLPDSTAPAGLVVVDPQALAKLETEMRLLLDDVRQQPPAESTAAEEAALLRLARLGYTGMRVLGPGFGHILRGNLNRALNDLVKKELAAAEPERKLALRHLQQAVHRYGVLMESLLGILGALDAAEHVTLLAELEQNAVTEISLGNETERMVMRFQLDVLVALDVLDASLDELTFWAFRALTDARRVEAIPAGVSVAGLKGELARARARSAWLNWDAAEVAKELAPWPSSTQ